MANEKATAAPVVESQTDALISLMDADKVKSIKAALGGDRIYLVSTADSTAYAQVEALLSKAGAATDTFHGLPILVNKAIDGDKANEIARICVATLGTRDKELKKNGYKAITIFPAPSAAEFLANQDANDFVSKLLERESADVAFGGLRAATTLTELETAINDMPIDVGSIISTSRESTGGLDTEAFDAVWTAFRRDVIAKQQPELAKALPSKAIVIKAIRSKSYAEAEPQCAPIEKRGLFVRLTNAVVKAGSLMKDSKGNPEPVDMSVVSEWLAGRDELHITYNAPTQVDESALDNIVF